MIPILRALVLDDTDAFSCVAISIPFASASSVLRGAESISSPNGVPSSRGRVRTVGVVLIRSAISAASKASLAWSAAAADSTDVLDLPLSNSRCILAASARLASFDILGAFSPATKIRSPLVSVATNNVGSDILVTSDRWGNIEATPDCASLGNWNTSPSGVTPQTGVPWS